MKRLLARLFYWLYRECQPLPPAVEPEQHTARMIGGPCDGKQIAIDGTPERIAFPKWEPGEGFGQVVYRRSMAYEYQQ